FSDGPRRVPRARGASAARAERLGLGTRDAARQLRRTRPEPRWVEAAGSTMPEHLRWPVELGRFGRGVGYVRRTRPDLHHDGVDIVADEGSTIRAVAPGIVAYSDNGVRGMGNVVMIVHPNGAVSVYAHCVRTTVQAGWRVQAGERIGFVGNTGISRGPHLHFEWRVRGRPVNPLPLFDGRPWISAYRRWTAQRRAGTYEAPSGYLGSLSSDRVVVREAPPTVTGEDVDGLREARRLLDEGAGEADLESVQGARFSTVLWPLRGGTRATSAGCGVNVHGPEGSAIRAAADGRVVYVGTGLRGVGTAIVLLHKNGWVSVYGHCARTDVQPGQQLQRGEWMGRSGAHLHFQLREGGRLLDPNERFAGAPAE
ncbi:MAG: M23 family metallopeptidase, partial [Myxococcota bacterium]